MPRLPKSPRASQLRLFQPPATTPRWESLPPEVQRHTLALLVRLLRAHARSGAQAAQEVRDE